MVFISVGTQKQQFTRIFKLVEDSKLLSGEEKIAQVGNTKFESKTIKTVESLSNNKFNECLENAELVICHGGVGTIFSALEKGKKVLVVPRLSKYKEHINDHQLEAAVELESHGYLVVYKEDKDYDYYVKKAQENKFKKYVSNSNFLNILR